MQVWLVDWDEDSFPHKPIGEWFLDSVLIGIPAKNESKHIADVVRACKPYGEVLVLNNGSTDGTEKLALDAGAIVESYTWSGYGRALREIFKWARTYNYDFLVTLDGDGQHDPSEIPKFLSAIRSADVVVGNRFMSKNDNTPLHRKAVIYALNQSFSLGDTQCGFRAYNHKAIESIKFAEDDMGASLEIIDRAFTANLKISEVSCKITYEDSKPAVDVLKQGMNLVEAAFWKTVWQRPYTYLGIPALLLFLTSFVFGMTALSVYVTQNYLVPNFVLISGISMLGALLLVVFAFFISIQRRVIKELNAK